MTLQHLLELLLESVDLFAVIVFLPDRFVRKFGFAVIEIDCTAQSDSVHVDSWLMRCDLVSCTLEGLDIFIIRIKKHIRRWKFG